MDVDHVDHMVIHYIIAKYHYLPSLAKAHIYSSLHKEYCHEPQLPSSCCAYAITQLPEQLESLRVLKQVYKKTSSLCSLHLWPFKYSSIFLCEPLDFPSCEWLEKVKWAWEMRNELTFAFKSNVPSEYLCWLKLMSRADLQLLEPQYFTVYNCYLVLSSLLGRSLELITHLLITGHHSYIF